MFIVIALLVAVGGDGYYYNIILPKEKLGQTDYLDDFDFENNDTKTVVNKRKIFTVNRSVYNISIFCEWTK